MTKSESQQLALAQNANLTDYKGAQTAIKTAAGLGNFSANYTIVTIASVAKVVESLKLNGFSVAQSGVDDEILAITFGA